MLAGDDRASMRDQPPAHQITALKAASCGRLIMEQTPHAGPVWEALDRSHGITRVVGKLHRPPQSEAA